MAWAHLLPLRSLKIQPSIRVRRTQRSHRIAVNVLAIAWCGQLPSALCSPLKGLLSWEDAAENALWSLPLQGSLADSVPQSEARVCHPTLLSAIGVVHLPSCSASLAHRTGLLPAFPSTLGEDTISSVLRGQPGPFQLPVTYHNLVSLYCLSLRKD